MNQLPSELASTGPATVILPPRQTLPVVFASPHSGRHYPQDLIERARIGAFELRASEDAFVDQLFNAAPKLGAPLLSATFPRAYVDVNRAAMELDPRMFDGKLPEDSDINSMRALSGLGSIPRVVSGGVEIYKTRLPAEEALSRIETFYRPYHTALQKLIAQTRATFGYCILIDCHSMPGDSYDSAKNRVDLVLGDCYGSSCHPSLTRFVDDCFRDMGFAPAHNDPYAGGYCTRHYGRPQEHVHSLQIELSRALYMDETTISPHRGFDVLRDQMTDLISRFHDLDGTLL
ncbi:N-formylglutamate amidohydrolase [Thalassospira indica]|uniref:N-formylglutamate amidohydrolase n=1 Tax=Thalassospira indica TaxID=1891279 RepID=A0ABN5NLB7_9PROT|nr:N-formylglutamate amidohydrolase [Thalassospira indica]AXO14558.1 N-formylglutamate amidohydrolase [Thalassospira indica]OAZ09988.1 N-formylglutamate amidohydrolase [Thalassospira profundimaris]